MEQIFEAARAGDQAARGLLENRACYLGIALANLVNMLNPEVILLGGMFAQGHDLIIPVAEAKMKEIAFAGLGDNVRITATDFGWRAGVVGAASLALTSFFYQQNEGK
jgi:predicted NBD/HSP70 family sugar kinase